MPSQRTTYLIYAALAAALFTSQLGAQAVHQQPVTDSAAQASPIIPSAANSGRAVDAATNASPMGSTASGEYIPGGTELHVHLVRAVGSGSARNGEMIPGVLDTPVRTSAGRTLAAGTPVSASVVVTVPAGTLMSAGEVTLQVMKVGNVDVFSDQVTHHGEMGPREVADSNPAKGTEANIAANTPLIFNVPVLPSL